MRPIASLLLAAALLAGPVWADVTVVSKTSGKGLGQAASGDSTTFVRGNKMRSEVRAGDHGLVSILDLDAGTLIVLDTDKKQAESYDLAKLRADMEKNVGASEAKVSLKKNGQKKTLLDKECEGYDVSIEVPTRMGGNGELGSMTAKLDGTAWLASGVEGFAEYAAFFKTAGEKGMFFSNPQQARAQPGQAKGMAEMYRSMAAAGMPLEMQMQMRMTGDGPLAAMMAKVGNMSFTSTVTEVSTRPLGDGLFAVPAGYKVKSK